MADLFNNISNNYIQPDLAACAGASDSNIFEFLPGEQVGIVSGSAIISAMGLGDISQPVDGWVQQTKILQPGELIFIQGLTKGITYRTQPFFIVDISSGTTYERDLYMSIDLSINYYNNFRYYQNSLFATADEANGITIKNALNIALDNINIKAITTYVDACTLTFTSTQEGYYFNITNVEVSTWVPDVSTYGETLVEDVSSSLPAFKYPNTAMLGYVLKLTYPDEEEYDKWIKINHVPDYLTYYTTLDVSQYISPGTWETSIYYVKNYKAVDVGLSGTSYDNDRLSAADYLDYVETNSLWEKVGPLRIWISTVDPETSLTENLITGFYVYNPHDFIVKLDYMTIL